MGSASHFGRLIFIHLQCWEVLLVLTIQRQWCIKILCPKDPEFYTPLALNCQKGQHPPALEVYKNQSPTLESCDEDAAEQGRRWALVTNTAAAPGLP